MKQALHIFKKDVSYLRYEILVSLLAALAFCFTGTRHAMTLSERPPDQMISWSLLNFFLPLTWWFLISRLVHAEALPGEQQFWLTRPYDRRSLLAAKALFIAVFVNIPLFVADVVIVRAFGFAATHEFAGLLWTQVLLTLAFVLPAMALSAIVNGFVPLIFAALLLCGWLLTWLIAIPILHIGLQWMQLGWMLIYYVLIVMGVGALTTVLWQYARRRTTAMRFVAGGTAMLVLVGVSLFPWTSAFAIQTHLSPRKIDPSSIHIGLDWDRKWLARVTPGTKDQMLIEIPLQISGTDAGTKVLPEGLTVTLQSPGGESWHVNQPPPAAVNFEGEVISLEADVDETFYRKVRNEPLQLRGTFFFTLYGAPQQTTIPFHVRAVPVEDMGVCSASGGADAKGSFLMCSSAFRVGAVRTAVFFASPSATTGKPAPQHGQRGYTRRSMVSYSPFPADLGLDPISQFFSDAQGSFSDVAIAISKPLAYIQKDFEIDNVRLSDFESHASTAIK
jgi:hypothetical protein